MINKVTIDFHIMEGKVFMHGLRFRLPKNQMMEYLMKFNLIYHQKKYNF